MKHAAPILIKFLKKNYPDKFGGIVRGLEAAERFVCTDSESLPEITNAPLAKQAITNEPLPLPYGNFIFEVELFGMQPVVLHVIRSDKSPGFVSISVYIPLIKDEGTTHGYCLQEVVLKGTVDQKWKVVRLLNEMYVISSPDVSEDEYREFVDSNLNKFESVVRSGFTHFMAFMKVISASNTTMHLNEVSKLKSSRSKGAIKSYYTVRLKETKKVSNHKSTGSHRSPVPHSRRSHIRRYSNGKSIIIPSSYINANMGSATNRHYEF